MAILLYCVEKWPITEADRKRLEGFHHNCLRRILNITWKDKITNESVQTKTNQSLVECTPQRIRTRMVWSCAAYGKCQSRRANTTPDTSWKEEKRKTEDYMDTQ